MNSHQRPRSIDLEKNIFQQQPITYSKTPIYFLTLSHIFLIWISITNNERLSKFHPLLNSVALGILTSGLAQSIIQCFKPVHYGKLLKFYTWGAINGILSSMWINYILSTFPEKDQVLHRFLTDQIIAAPLFLFVFMSFHCLWEDVDLILSLKTGFVRNLLASYCIWPFASIIGFGGWIDESSIFGFNCFVSLVWTVALGVLNWFERINRYK